MKSAQLLDCTLRDGAYLVEKEFGEDVIRGIISGLLDAGTDIIEIGFLQDEGFGPGKTVFLDSKEARCYIPESRGNAMFAVLADYSRYSIQNLDVFDGTSFDAVRICFFKNERYDALEYFKAVKEKGYKLFIQPVDILGYSDAELIELVELINPIEPYCFSIVDTFGSMYMEDLQRVFSIIDHNLCTNCRIGFHSHNNMQMSSALSQAFLRIATGHRGSVIDATISGMGRGAGNTPTELIAQYMVSKLHYNYNIDTLLDIIDNYIVPLKSRVTWGYNTDMFLAGTYGAHVNNISYLKKKNSICSKNIRFILNEIGPVARKRYNYDLLEQTYLELVASNIDDHLDIQMLKDELKNQSVVIIAPGKTAASEAEKIQKYVIKNRAKVISINFVPSTLTPDYLYMNNVKRYETYQHKKTLPRIKEILTSNVSSKHSDNTYVVSFCRLYKCGWQYSDNSAILLLRLLDLLNVKQIGIAGLDGYDPGISRWKNYAEEALEIPIEEKPTFALNQEIEEMLRDYLATKRSGAEVQFITTSRFSGVCK